MIAGSPSLREIRKAIVTALENATLPGSPDILQTPVFPQNDNELPAISVFDGGRSSTSNSAHKLFRGDATLNVGLEITVKAKGDYADELDELTDAALEVILSSDESLNKIGNVLGYETRPDFEKAEIPLARNIVTISLKTQEKFNAPSSGNPAPLQEVNVKLDISDDESKNIDVTFTPPQT